MFLDRSKRLDFMYKFFIKSPARDPGQALDKTGFWAWKSRQALGKIRFSAWKPGQALGKIKFLLDFRGAAAGKKSGFDPPKILDSGGPGALAWFIVLHWLFLFGQVIVF